MIQVLLVNFDHFDQFLISHWKIRPKSFKIIQNFNQWQISVNFELSQWQINKTIKRVKCPFFNTSFLFFWDHKWKTFKSRTFRFLWKLPNTLKKNCEKFDWPGLSHFCAMPIWMTVQIHMTHPVYQVR